MPDLKLADDELGQIAMLDYTAAQMTMQDVIERKLDDYAIYRNFRSDTTDGNAGRLDTDARGPFNWSRLTVPFAVFVVETLMSRVALDTPQVVVSPRSIAAMPYAEAKQLRINRMLSDISWRQIVKRGVKDFFVIGDGIVKVQWNNGLSRPEVVYVPWRDFSVSTEAQTIDGASCQFHRTWHTRQSLAKLAGVRGRNGRRLYRNIDRISEMTMDRSTADDFWLTARQYAGAGTPQPPRPGTTQVPVIECWYDDDTFITVGGPGYNIVLRSCEGPYTKPDGDKWRPYVSFANTLDPESPWAISDIEPIRDIQREATLLTNQAIDQTTRNINRATFYDKDRISSAQVDAAYSRPGGKAGVNGDPRSVIFESPATVLSRDYDQSIGRLQAWVTMVTGISDYEKSAPPSPNPAQSQTATGTLIRAQESNRRIDYKIALISDSVHEIACRLDWLDRQYNKRKQMVVPVSRGYTPRDGQLGITVHPDDGVAVAAGNANSATHEYDITIDSGSLSAPLASETAQRALMLAHTIMDPNLGLADSVNKPELAAMIVDASGFEPQRILSPAGPPAADQGQGAPQGPVGGAGPGAGAPPGPGGPGGVLTTPGGLGPMPIGPPEPVGPAPPGAVPGQQLTPEEAQAVMAAQAGQGQGARPGQIPVGPPVPAGAEPGGMPPGPLPPGLGDAGPPPGPMPGGELTPEEVDALIASLQGAGPPQGG